LIRKLDDQSTNQFRIFISSLNFMNTPLHPNSPCSNHSEIPAGFCTKLVSVITNLKDELQHQYEVALPGLAEQIQHAVAEAEALAWETSFPHLFLPDLAEARIAALTVTDSQRRYSRAA